MASESDFLDKVGKAETSQKGLDATILIPIFV